MLGYYDYFPEKTKTELRTVHFVDGSGTTKNSAQRAPMKVRCRCQLRRWIIRPQRQPTRQ